MRPASADTSDEAARAQLEVYRRMEPSRRLEIGLELTAMSRHLMAEGIRARHPEYSEEEVHHALLRLWLGPELFARAYPGSRPLDP